MQAMYLCRPAHAMTEQVLGRGCVLQSGQRGRFMDIWHRFGTVNASQNIMFKKSNLSAFYMQVCRIHAWMLYHRMSRIKLPCPFLMGHHEANIANIRAAEQVLTTPTKKKLCNCIAF